MSAGKEPISVGKIMNHMVRRWKGRSRLMEGMALFYWPKVAGPEIAGKTQAEKMMAGTLWVRTNDPTLAHHLTFLIPKMIDRYQQVMGPKIVRGIRFVIGQIETNPQDKPVQEDKIHLSEVIMEAAAAIDDEKLRSTFLRAARFSKIKDVGNRGKGWKPCSCGILTENGDFCPECQRKEDEEKKDLLYFFLSRHPEMPWEKARDFLPEIGRIQWEKARTVLRHKAGEQLRLTAIAIRKNKKNDISVLIPHAQKYRILGGSEKELQHLIGVDFWRMIPSEPDSGGATTC